MHGIYVSSYRFSCRQFLTYNNYIYSQILNLKNKIILLLDLFGPFIAVRRVFTALKLNSKHCYIFVWPKEDVIKIEVLKSDKITSLLMDTNCVVEELHPIW